MSTISDRALMQTRSMFAPRTNRSTSGQNQADAAIEAIWRSKWPYVTASILGFFMLLFGLAVAGLEAAGLELGSSSIDISSSTTDVKISSSRSKSLDIGVGIWSGAIVAVAAALIFYIGTFFFTSSSRNLSLISFL